MSPPMIFIANNFVCLELGHNEIAEKWNKLYDICQWPVDMSV